MLDARERRAAIQKNMLSEAGDDQCLVCLTLNIPGDIKRTPLTRMLFDRGIKEFDALGLTVCKKLIVDEATGTEGFWLVKEDGARVKSCLEGIEDSFSAARLFDFDVLIQDGTKLSRAVSRRCFVCGAPAAECARSRRHGLEAVRSAADDLLKDYCAYELALAAYESLLDELYTTPKPGLVDRMSCGAHTDMDLELFQKSAASLRPYLKKAARMGMEQCRMDTLRPLGVEAEKTMFAATGGVNTHKGLIYSMGLLMAGMGKTFIEGGSCINHAAELALQDAGEQLRKSFETPSTNGGRVYRRYGVKGATGEAAAGFPNAVYCAERLHYYMEKRCKSPGSLAFCDMMTLLDDTNLLHRGGQDGLEFVKKAAAEIAAMPAADRLLALSELDSEMIMRNLSPGGSADMLALAFLLERWRVMSADLMWDEGRES